MQVADILKTQFGAVSPKKIAIELEIASSKYHVMAAWVAIIFNPIFAYTDYINLRPIWLQVGAIRLFISLVTLVTLILVKRYKWPSHFLVTVPLLFISLQNAYVFSLITNKDVLGHNINFIALLIGASLFLILDIRTVVAITLLSAFATALSVARNSQLDTSNFLVQGGFLLMAVAIFMILSIRARYNLTVKEITARILLQASNEEILRQAEEVKATNENLEMLVQSRTQDLQKKNDALEEYAWINAHKLRSPVASILGLVSLMKREEVTPEVRIMMNHLQTSTERLDEVVSSITHALECGDDSTTEIKRDFKKAPLKKIPAFN
ncbi:MAG: HAMP domain-containing histidine kinase [Bacteroidetes bacterium]|nr:HAMP domain-containing histidine kinase [Bacteroidota bacterium]